MAAGPPSGTETAPLTSHAIAFTDDIKETTIDTGSTVESFGQHSVTVSNEKGYLCALKLESRFEVPPPIIYGILTNPDNSGIFRDIRGAGSRRVLRQEPGFNVVEVEQLGQARVLMFPAKFTTLLTVEEDARDPECLATRFSLIKSSLMARFNGTWELRPEAHPATGRQRTRAVLNQHLLPAFIPPFLSRVPVIGSTLRGVSVRALKRLVEDIEKVVEVVNGGAELPEALAIVKRKNGFRA